MIIKDAITGPAGSGKTTKLYQLRRDAEKAGLRVLEISAYGGDSKESVQKMITRALPDVILLDDWSSHTCKWHPKDLVGPATTTLYYVESN